MSIVDSLLYVNLCKLLNQFLTVFQKASVCFCLRYKLTISLLNKEYKCSPATNMKKSHLVAEY